MSSNLINLCSIILHEHFGEVCECVGINLIRHGAKPLRLIARETKLPPSKVKHSLRVLIQHNLAMCEKNKKGVPTYSVDPEKVALILRYARYIYTTKLFYGDSAELLVEELLNNGSMTMSGVMKKVLQRELEADATMNLTVAAIKEKFCALVETRFIQRCPDVNVQSTDETKQQEIKNMYLIPEIKLYLVDEACRPRAKEEEPPPAKKLKLEAEVKQLDDGIYWKVNFERFHQYIRDQLIISTVEKRIDKRASEMMRTILRLTETRSYPWADRSSPVSRHEIAQCLKKESKITVPNELVDSYLAVMTEDSASFILKVDSGSGGMYSVNFEKAMEKLCESTAVSVVENHFGSKSCRIFRLLLAKKYLEQKQIEEMAMIPAKDAKELTYRLLQDNFLACHEIPRTPDHAPSRTYFLFHVNLRQLCFMLRENCYKAMFNAMRRREYETKEHKRLLEKKQRVDAIISTLQQSGVEETQIKEVEEMITPPEQALLDHVKHVTSKLETSELQLDETLFLLNVYLRKTEKVVPNKNSKN